MMGKDASINEDSNNDITDGNVSPVLNNEDEKSPEPESDKPAQAAITEDNQETSNAAVDEEQAKLEKEAFLAAKRREIEENVKKALEERKLKEATERKARLEAKGELWEETTYVHAVYKRLRKEGLSPAEAMARSREEYEEEKTEGVELERRMEDLMMVPKKKSKKKKKRNNKKGGNKRETNVKENETTTEIIDAVPLTEKEARLRAKKEIIAQRRKEREDRRKNEMFSALFGL